MMKNKFNFVPRLFDLLITILLTCIFFIVITPFSLVLRIFNYDPLDLKWKNKYSNRKISKESRSSRRKIKRDNSNYPIW